MIKQQSDIVAAYDSQLKQDFYQILPNIDLGIGASFCKLLNDNKSLMTIKLGYEFHYWLHQNMMSRLRTQYTGTHGHYVLPERLKGDFSLGGIDLSVRFDF